MKLTLLTLLLAFSYTLLFGQITIVDTDLPKAKDSLTSSQAVNFSIDYASTGPDYQWDFSNLSFLSQITRVYKPMTGVPILINVAYGPFAVTKYRSTYYMPYMDLPLSQISDILPLQFDLGDINQYTKKQATKLTLVGYSLGISGQGIPMKSDSIETKYVFPLTYGTEFVSTGYTNFDLSQFIDAQWVQKRKRHTVVDGWGEITTPYGTFDVLRVQHRVEETDTIGYEGNVFGLEIPVVYEYEWLAKNELTPILKITTSELMGNETVISIEYKDYNFLGTEKLGVEKLEMYPNPVNDELTVSWKAGNKQLTIYHIDGTIVKQLSFDETTLSISTTDLTPGMYFVTVECNGEAVTNSLVKE
ncbi:MAG: T9SS type A sorting domain-containing protein [Crocinitomicaceae bacterium]|nr:T9SS type A sorting domain-containing protein [Crocinitomicaceae bacterium]